MALRGPNGRERRPIRAAEWYKRCLSDHHAAEPVRFDGALESHDCSVTYARGDRTLAVATVSRDRESLEAEVAMEHETAPARR